MLQSQHRQPYFVQLLKKFEDKEETIGIIQRIRDTINRILGREIQSVEETDDDEMNMANSA